MAEVDVELTVNGTRRRLRVDPRKTLAVALGFYALFSLAAVFTPTLGGLILIRFFQGAAASGPAVFAPGFIRALFAEERATSMIGLQGSMESLVPAVAPIAGAWLLIHFGWRASFVVIGIAAIKEEEALASVNHNVAEIDEWEAAHFKEDGLRNAVLEAKKQYEDALRMKFFDF